MSRIARLLGEAPVGRPASQELRELCDELYLRVKDSYSSIATHYATVRGDCPIGIDADLLGVLLQMARDLSRRGVLRGGSERLRLLDVGTGSGRDLRYLSTFDDVWVVGVDVAGGFLEWLGRLQRLGELPMNSVAGMDMRHLGFAGETFDIVRHNATLLHLPLIGPGCGVDEALAETRRVLRPNGILFALVKEGCGFGILDTGEGLGDRFFQFFGEGELESAMQRNGFSVLRVDRRETRRAGNSVKWIAVFAQRV